jgi:hypothetical protein
MPLQLPFPFHNLSAAEIDRVFEDTAAAQETVERVDLDDFMKAMLEKPIAIPESAPVKVDVNHFFSKAKLVQ